MISSGLSAAILAACALWPAPAQSEETVDVSANGFMPGCRFTIERGGAARASEMQLVFDSGRCNGFVSAVALTDSGVCLPRQATIDQMLRVVVHYVDARPERMHEAFATLAQEALRAAWPCKRQ
jgi:Rap1a immunity proteins